MSTVPPMIADSVALTASSGIGAQPVVRTKAREAVDREKSRITQRDEQRAGLKRAC